MHGLIRRTSVTKDEAVAILLGWSDGPIEFTSSNPDPSEEEEALLESLAFSVADELETLQDNLESGLAEAMYEKQPGAVINKLRSNLEAHAEVVRLANTYLCAINDELNKGEQSGLRIDKELTNSAYIYITLTSLKEWEQGRCGQPITEPARSSTAIVGKQTASPVVRRKMRDQEESILSVITSLGYVKNLLPRRDPGKSGVKALIRKELAKDPLFTAPRAFDKAWEQLRSDGSIAEQA